jgi:hypothetical protein
MQTLLEEIAMTEFAHDERVTGLAYNTLYYVFYSDPYLAGGAVTYYVSAIKYAVLASPGNFFVGSILTPPQGGQDTVGNNDGGVGAQGGLTMSVFATAVNTTGSWTNTNQAIDGNASTPATIGGVTSGTIVVSGFPATTLYGGQALNVAAFAQVTGPGTASISYSTDGGATFTAIQSISPPTGTQQFINFTDYQVTLPPNISLANVQVKLEFTGAALHDNAAFYEAWVANLK